MINTAIALV